MSIINAGQRMSDIIDEMLRHGAAELGLPEDQVDHSDYNRGTAYSDPDHPGRITGFELSIWCYEIGNEEHGVTVYFSPTGRTNIYAGAVAGEPLVS